MDYFREFERLTNVVDATIAILTMSKPLTRTEWFQIWNHVERSEESKESKNRLQWYLKRYAETEWGSMPESEAWKRNETGTTFEIYDVDSDEEGEGTIANPIIVY